MNPFTFIEKQLEKTAAQFDGYTLKVNFKKFIPRLILITPFAVIGWMADKISIISWSVCAKIDSLFGRFYNYEKN